MRARCMIGNLRPGGGGAASVRVTRESGMLTVVVEDNGVGLPAEAAGGPLSGVGIEGMEERAALLGGQLRITSEPGRGTVVRVTAPAEGSEH